MSTYCICDGVGVMTNFPVFGIGSVMSMFALPIGGGHYAGRVRSLLHT